MEVLILRVEIESTFFRKRQGVSDFSNFRFQFDFCAYDKVESKLLYIYPELEKYDFQVTEI